VNEHEATTRLAQRLRSILPDGRDPFAIDSLNESRGNGRPLSETEWWFFQREFRHDFAIDKAPQIAERAVRLAHAEALLRDLGASFAWPEHYPCACDWEGLGTSTRTCVILDRGAAVFRLKFDFATGEEESTIQKHGRRYYEALTAWRAIEESLNPGLGWKGGDASRRRALLMFGALAPVPLQYFGPVEVPRHLADLTGYDVVIPTDEAYGKRSNYMRRSIVRVVHVDPDVRGMNLGAHVLLDKPLEGRTGGEWGARSIILYGFQKPEVISRASRGEQLGIGVCGDSGSIIGWSGAIYPRGTPALEEILRGSAEVTPVSE
jgi:hypothetical protein